MSDIYIYIYPVWLNPLTQYVVVMRWHQEYFISFSHKVTDVSTQSKDGFLGPSGIGLNLSQQGTM